jgi:hypothetical protein
MAEVVIPWVAALAVLIVGVYLYRLGRSWDPARDRRRCPACWYELGDIEVDRCPECGKPTTDGTTLRDTRPSPPLVTTGIIVAAMAGIVLWLMSLVIVISLVAF